MQVLSLEDISIMGKYTLHNRKLSWMFITPDLWRICSMSGQLEVAWLKLTMIENGLKFHTMVLMFRKANLDYHYYGKIYFQFLPVVKPKGYI